MVVRDLCGRVVETLDAEGGLTRLVRDRAGRIVETTDPDGRTTRYGWDACGRPAWQEAPDGGRTDYTYDADWRVVAVETPDGRTEAAYDECGRMIRLTRPGRGTSSWSYDRAGRLREERSAAWGHIRYAHDAAGRLTAVTNALGGTTRFDYDQCGRLVSTTDPLGRTTSRTYTASDKVETLTDPLGAVTRAGYDAAGRQTWQTDPAGGRLDFSYDEAGRPTLTVGTDADGEVVLRSRESWSGRTTLRAQGLDGADEIDVDRLGRPLAHRRDGRTVSTWAWSAGGELLERTGPGAERMSVARDDDAGTVSLDGTAFGRVTLTRDRAGRLTSMSGPGLRQTWQWDAAGRMTLHEAVVDGASTRSEVVYDDAGRPLRVTGPEGTTSYSYDAAGQLVSVEGPRGRETLTWDAAGALRERRRVSETGEEVERFSYDGAGRLTARVRDGGATTYTYDAAGRRTGQEGPDGRCRYTWSPAGLLMSVSVQGPGRDQERVPEPSGDGGESGDGEPVTWRIERDALGLPVRIGGTEVTWDVATAVPSISSFDGASVTALPGALAVDGVLRPAGWRTARAGGSADPWAIPAAVVGREGEGRPAVGGPGAGMGADAAGDPAGGPVLTASGTLGVGGLELLGARAYDPGTAAFLTPDPLTHAPTAPWTANPYSYAANSPLSFSDPLGLKPLSDAESQAVVHRAQGGQAAQDQGAVLDPRLVSGRERPAARGLHREQLDGGPAAAQRLEPQDHRDPVARPDRPGAALNDLADRIEAGLLGEGRAVREPTAAVERVDAADVAGQGAHEDLAVARTRRRDLLDPQHLGSAAAMVLDGPHLTGPPRRGRRRRARPSRLSCPGRPDCPDSPDRIPRPRRPTGRPRPPDPAAGR